jgi:hypothetical protein
VGPTASGFPESNQTGTGHGPAPPRQPCRPPVAGFAAHHRWFTAPIGNATEALFRNKDPQYFFFAYIHACGHYFVFGSVFLQDICSSRENSFFFGGTFSLQDICSQLRQYPRVRLWQHIYSLTRYFFNKCAFITTLIKVLYSVQHLLSSLRLSLTKICNNASLGSLYTAVSSSNKGGKNEEAICI